MKILIVPIKTHRQTLHRFITASVTVIAVLIIYWLFKSAQIENEFIFQPCYIIAALFFALLQKLLSPLIIKMIFQSMNQKTSFLSLFWITMFSTAANSSVPFPAGVPVRMVLQKRVLDISYPVSASGLIIEMILSYACMIIICIITSMLCLAPMLNDQIIILKKPILSICIIIALILVFVCFIFLRRFKNGLGKYLKYTIEKIQTANYGILILVIVLILFSIIISLVRFEMILYSMGLYIAPALLLAAMLLSYLAGVISLIPMGLGVRDVSLGSLLVLLSIPLSLSVSVITIDRIIISVIYLIGSVIATHILGKNMLNLKEKTIEEVNVKNL